MEAWTKVQKARRVDRPTAQTYIEYLCPDFIELHGDRQYGDDKAIIGGIGSLSGIPVTLIGTEKGTKTRERIYRNFGMSKPEGYRKALRLMKEAEKFNRPIITIIDTAGAYCGIDAEERGQGQAIAQNLYEMSQLRTPIISIIIGEGGSGGALALAVSDEVWMLENAVYSILSPEGFASILYKDSTLVKQAAQEMKITALDLESLGIIDRIIYEPEEGIHLSPDRMLIKLKSDLYHKLQELNVWSRDALVENRYKRFRFY